MSNNAPDYEDNKKEQNMMDIKFYEEENKILRQMANNWKAMYENLKKEYEEAVKAYDALVMETVKKDLGE